MKLKTILLAIFLTTVCVESRAGDDSSFYKDQYIDTAFINEALVGVDDECFYNLFNIYSEALADGLVVNAARSGLSTNTPAGTSLETDGLYYQLLRIFSYFDMELGRQLHIEMDGKCLPQDVSIGAGVLSREYLEDFEKPYSKQVNKIRRAMDIAAPGEGQFDLIQLNSDHFPHEFDTGTMFTDEFQADLLDGIYEKQLYIEQQCSQNDDLEQKLKGLLASYYPLSGMVTAHFPPVEKSQSQLRMEVYLPPFRELDVPDFDRAETWTLRQGVSKTELPVPVDISIAKLTHVGYLYDFHYDRSPIIKLELYKDFAKPHLVKTRVLFGEIDEEREEEGMLPVRFDDYRNTLYVSFYPHIADKPEDNFTVKNLKKIFNEVAGGYKMDARIHQLTLYLEREPGQSYSAIDATDPFLKPRFSFKDSDISFRLTREASDAAEVTRLGNVGFVCEEKTEQNTTRCWQDFGAFDGVVSYLTAEIDAENQRDWWKTLGGIFKRLVNVFTRVNTKFIIDQNIRTIEDAIDVQFVEIFSDLMDELDADRAEIRDKIDSQFFN